MAELLPSTEKLAKWLKIITLIGLIVFPSLALSVH